MVICDLLGKIRLALKRFKNSKELEETFILEGMHFSVEFTLTKRRRLELVKPDLKAQDSA